MPGPKPPAINLNDVERQGLELLVRRYTTGQQKVIRARIVLLAAMGKNNREIVANDPYIPCVIDFFEYHPFYPFPASVKSSIISIYSRTRDLLISSSEAMFSAGIPSL